MAMYNDFNLNETVVNTESYIESKINATRFSYSISNFEIAMIKVNYYGYPIIFIIGFFSNIIAYLVFTRTRLKKVPSVPYLAGIAVADSGCLSTFFFTSLTYTHNLPLMNQVGICQFGTFFNYVFLFLSLWYLVAMVVEKFISVYWPLKKCTLCTVFRAKVVLIGVAVLAIVSYSYILYFVGPQHDKYSNRTVCLPWPDFKQPFENLMMLDTLVVAVIPYFIIIILIILIIIRGCEYYRISSTSDFAPRRPASRCKLSHTSLPVTTVLFPLVLLVLVCQLPLGMMRLIGLFNRRNPNLEIVNRVLIFLQDICFAFKIFVYLCFSASFRSSLKELICLLKERCISLNQHEAVGDLNLCHEAVHDHHQESIGNVRLNESNV